jgi:hypothetical protein
MCERRGRLTGSILARRKDDLWVSKSEESKMSSRESITAVMALLAAIENDEMPPDAIDEIRLGLESQFGREAYTCSIFDGRMPDRSSRAEIRHTVATDEDIVVFANLGEKRWPRRQ